MLGIIAEMDILDIASKQVSEASVSTIAMVTVTAVLGVTYAASKFMKEKNLNYPPHIPSTIPYLGQAVNFNLDSTKFLLAAYQKYGPVFSFTMVGKTFTYLIGSEASALFFNSKNDQLNAEKVYGKLTTPVFGPGVAYDVPNPVFLEQKKMLKTGLNIARFRQHIPMIQDEVECYFQRWGDSGEKNIFAALSEVIILTASRCLHGPEIRSQLNEEVAELYWDLDGGFSHLAWLLPTWVPLPSFRKRDSAHLKIKQMFYKAIDKRRQLNKTGDKFDDLLQTLLDSKYKSGRHLSDDEVAGMCIGLLLAGQHTSSTTTSWVLFYLAANKHIQEQCYDELMNTYSGDEAPLDYDGLKRLDLLDRCMKEALRLRPPLFTVMRQVESPQQCMGFTIPEGHQVCVSPPVNQMLPGVWPNRETFDPERFVESSVSTSEDRFNYVPFGAGRHRCIGETFAYVQVKTIVSVLLRKYEFNLVDGRFPPIDKTTMIQIPEKPIISYRLRKA